MSKHTIIFDIETYPDRDVWFDAPEEPKESTEEATPAPKKRGRPKKDAFPPLYAHQVICLGFMYLKDDVPAQLASMVAHDGASESFLLTSFSSWLSSFDESPTIVTWNGRGFDMPVIKLRSVLHGISQTWETPDHRRKYSETGHIDLFDVYREFGLIEFKGYSLDTISRVIGLPANTTNGNEIAELFEAGKIEEISAKCRVDVVKTTYLYFRFLLLRGRITRAQYQEKTALLRAEWEKDPAFGGFVIRKIAELR